ncbi:MAG TPA: hypothetical protein VLZ03_16130 [Thermodesulfobacteriota bacterium]|nr:hypothetical protein [Thermodesulfobacteriota bacterium]
MRKMVALGLIVLVCSLICTNLFAEEKKYDLNPAFGIKDILKENMGKRVYVRMESGEEILGIVAKVGDQLVQISEVAGRDFYDAAIRIDRINAVMFKVRGN